MFVAWNKGNTGSLYLYWDHCLWECMDLQIWTFTMWHFERHPRNSKVWCVNVEFYNQIEGGDQTDWGGWLRNVWMGSEQERLCVKRVGELINNADWCCSLAIGIHTLQCFIIQALLSRMAANDYLFINVFNQMPCNLQIYYQILNTNFLL